MSKEARPISLRQLMVFGRSLNEQRLISSANYVRTELPRRYVLAYCQLGHDGTTGRPRGVLRITFCVICPTSCVLSAAVDLLYDPCLLIGSTFLRIAHRLRDMQTLPYCVVANSNFNEVYELYYEAFDKFRRIPEIRTLDDNDSFCEVISDTLKKHLSVIPKLAMGILETSADEMLPAKELDGFMNAILRSVSHHASTRMHSTKPNTVDSEYLAVS